MGIREVIEKRYNLRRREIVRRAKTIGLSLEEFEDKHSVHCPFDRLTTYPIMRHVSPYAYQVGFLEESRIVIEYSPGNYKQINAALETMNYLKAKNIPMIEKKKEEMLEELEGLNKRVGNLTSKIIAQL